MGERQPGYRYRGGSYNQIHKLPHRIPGVGALECHHVIPKDCLVRAGLNPGLGPAIQMEEYDHTTTETFGSSRTAKAARKRIDGMLATGDYDRAFETGAADVRSASGETYVEALTEAFEWHATWREVVRERTPSDGGTAGPGSKADGSDTVSHAIGTGGGDVTELLKRLTSYSEALDRHNLTVQRAYDKAEESLAHLRRVYGGAAADDFFSHWHRTTEAFEGYLQGARAIKELLDARILALRQADRPSDAR